MIDMDDLAARLHSHFILYATCPTGCDHKDAPTEEHAVAIVALDYTREALLSEESIERAALGIHASHDRGDWDEELPVVQGEYLDMARAGLARLMEGESNE